MKKSFVTLAKSMARNILATLSHALANDRDTSDLTYLIFAECKLAQLRKSTVVIRKVQAKAGAESASEPILGLQVLRTNRVFVSSRCPGISGCWPD